MKWTRTLKNHGLFSLPSTIATWRCSCSCGKILEIHIMFLSVLVMETWIANKVFEMAKIVCSRSLGSKIGKTLSSCLSTHLVRCRRQVATTTGQDFGTRGIWMPFWRFWWIKSTLKASDLFYLVQLLIKSTRAWVMSTKSDSLITFLDPMLHETSRSSNCLNSNSQKNRLPQSVFSPSSS